jgi:hypothetical protein
MDEKWDIDLALKKYFFSQIMVCCPFICGWIMEMLATNHRLKKKIPHR